MDKSRNRTWLSIFKCQPDIGRGAHPYRHQGSITDALFLLNHYRSHRFRSALLVKPTSPIAWASGVSGTFALCRGTTWERT